MAKDLKERRRSVNVDALTPEEAERVGFELGKRISEITDRAAEEVNKLTAIYGVRAKVAVQLTDSNTGETETVT